MIHLGLLISSAVLRRALDSILREYPDVGILFSSPWIGPSLPLEDFDVLVTELPQDGEHTLWEQLSTVDPQPGVLFLADEPDQAYKLSEISTAAWGLMPVDSSAEELYAAILAVNAGLVIWHPDMAPGLLNGLKNSNERNQEEMDIEPLTDREIEVLQLLGLGYTNKKIAYDLSISEHTAKFHISSIYGKLSAGNRTEAVRIGLQAGLISL